MQEVCQGVLLRSTAIGGEEGSRIEQGRNCAAGQA